MKRIIYPLFIIILMGLNAWGQTVPSGGETRDLMPGIPAPSNIRSAKYPEILPDHRVVFRIKAPGVQKMQIDLGRKYDMVKDTAGYWNLITDSIGEGFHYYSILIDGFAAADPGSESFYGMGRMASGIEIPFAKGDYYAQRHVPHGDIRIKKYYSTITRSWHQIYIYMPPGYDANMSENILCFTFYTAGAKMNAAGQRRAKQI